MAKCHRLVGIIALSGVIAGMVGGCAPSWAPSQVPRPKPGSAPQADPDGLGEYRSAPLGERVRSKRLRALLLSVGDTAVYEYRSEAGVVTLSAVLRSYTSFKSASIDDLRAFLEKVKTQYQTAGDEIDTVRRFVEQAIDKVTYYRLDARYRIGADKGAILIYEFVEDGEDRLLGTHAIAPETALGIIHFADADGFELAVNETILAPYFVAVQEDSKLRFEPRRTSR